ncbi:tetratricopeptide repeat protein [Calothrix sp. PCC 6303]|uniref:tetratricopeptide repeat protein n=1 Tax=Calothrix sp. PCC 6303 TaxID=1170562 RepID=UPI0002A0175A|nr:tetratricopeptide repeat protein [Calothrix sp. PCC 6303]AFZ00644.1 Tetratricopeptide TPR_2 repeat-containing protein [Calothrix sp. PCC 6303]
MPVLRFDLKLIQKNNVELRYFFNNKTQYEQRNLDLAEIADLVKIAERDYYTSLPESHDVTGRRLFNWLDGNERWLSRAIGECRGQELVVAIKAEQQLTHLPWEVLHDGTEFLINRVNPVVVPVRWVEGNGVTQELETRALRVLFMATSPVDVEPVLDFEGEEAKILEATQATNSPVELRVEESGSTSGLKRVWSRYSDHNIFDVFHLSGHASINEDGVPCFITEDETGKSFYIETETGKRFGTTAEELAGVLQFRFPKLVFLSGCRTGESVKNGTLPSMAEALIGHGATAVLGWGRPVMDTSATMAAAQLYGKLANGYSLPQALAVTYRFLLKEQIRDWHLLRLYVRGECPGALVQPLEDQVWMPPEPVYEQFLDPATQQVRVATPDQFVGRRRTLQRCLLALRKPSNLGVLIHGMGGLGKSTVTARLLERMIGYDRIVIYRGLDEAKLINLLSQQCTAEAGHEILNGKLPLMQRLTKFLQGGLNSDKQRFIFVLDDFEANLESGELQGQNHVLKPEVVSVLTALFQAIQQSRLPHRVIITCRYDFRLPQFDRNLYREPLAALRNADLIKKYNRLQSFNGTIKIDSELELRAKKAADGNPRLLEWLDKILCDGITDVAVILAKIESKEKEFREDILAEELLKQQHVDLKRLLGTALIYELPVVKDAISAICQDIGNLDSHIQRAVGLGLLEVNVTSNEELYRVSRILEALLLVAEDGGSLAGEAAKVLYRLWWEEAETSTEEQKLEIHRLALLGRETEIAGNLASNIANKWWHKSRYRETVELCKSTLDITQDYRVLKEMAYCQQQLGEVEQALKNYQQAKKLCPLSDETETASICHYLAIIYAQQGKVEHAIALYQQSLELKEKIGDIQGKAASLHQLAIIYAQQGEVEQAITLHQQSLELNEKIGNIQGKSASLHCLAMIYARQGEVEHAIALYQQSLDLLEKIGNIQGKAASLHQLAGIYAQQGEVEHAIALFQQSLDLYEKIGDVQGKAASLHCLAGIYAQQGEVEQAIALFQQSLDLYEKIGDVQGKAMTLWWLGHIAQQQGNYTTALEYLQESFNILQRIKSPDAEKVGKLISEVQFN